MKQSYPPPPHFGNENRSHLYGLSHLDTFAKPFTLTFTLTFTLAAALTLTALLAACGGGGGGTPTTPVVTYTAATACASGPALTSTVSQEAANALVPASCPALTTDQLNAIVVTRASNGTLSLTLPAGITFSSKTVTFTMGNTVVGSSIDTAGNITPNSVLSAGTWTVTFNGQPVGAPAVTNRTLTSVIVPVVTCAAGENNISGSCITIAVPLAGADKWNAATSARVPAVAADFTWLANGGGTGIGVWAANTGIRISSPTTLPVTVVNVGDEAYKAEAASGRIKYAYDGINLYGYYITPNAVGNVTAYVIMPINPNTGGSLLASQAIGDGGIGQTIDWMQADVNSEIDHVIGSANCARYYPDVNTNWVTSMLTGCPN